MQRFEPVRGAHNPFRAAVISSTRIPVYAKQKLSPLRSRGLLFLCLVLAVFLLALPRTSRADFLEDAARALARKVALMLNAHEAVSVSIRNLSSLSSDQVSGLSQAFEAELRSRDHRVSHDDSSRVSLRVTLSENLTGILEIGELVENGQSRFSFERVTLAPVPSGRSVSKNFTLVKELVWKQESPILDLKFLTVAGEKPERVAVLSPNILSLHENTERSWSLLKSFPIPRSGPQVRNPRGQLFKVKGNVDSRLVVELRQLSCWVDLGGALDSTKMECTSNEKESLVGLRLLTAGPILFDNAAKWNSSGNSFTGEIYGENGYRLKIPPFYSAAILGFKPGESTMFLIAAGIDGRARLVDNSEKELRSFTGWGTELTTILSDCDSSWHILTSDTTDWTEADKVTSYQFEEPSSISLDQSIELPGPVLSIGSEQIPAEGDPKGSRSGAIAVVRNVKTGEYEAYRISVACSR
jgi:hypothetical protein